jgi:hypothetical protein
MCAYGIVLRAFALGASIALAAWTAPLNGPPTCTSGNPGCDAPLNISSTAQTKTGSLTVSGSGNSITAPQFCIGASCITTWPSGGGGGTIGGSGTGTYIPVWNSNGSSLGNSTMTDRGGTVVNSNAVGLALSGKGTDGVYGEADLANGTGVEGYNTASGVETLLASGSSGDGSSGIYTTGSIFTSQTVSANGGYVDDGYTLHGFGGMYTLDQYGGSWTSDHSCNVENPLTGNCTCPSRYGATFGETYQQESGYWNESFFCYL